MLSVFVVIVAHAHENSQPPRENFDDLESKATRCETFSKQYLDQTFAGAILYITRPIS